MSDAPVATLDPQMPIPMGVIAETGECRPRLSADNLHHISPDSAVVLARGQRGRVLGVDSSVDDPMDLSQAGWCIVFPSDSDAETAARNAAIKEALQPLIAFRQAQVNNDRLFKVFDAGAGVRPNQTAGSWAMAKGVSLSAPVAPKKGVPYYLLLVGPPARISFDFQAQFDLQWAVGRLHFDDVKDYADYAQKVVDYESGKTPAPVRQAALWMPRNQLDLATPLLAGSIGPDFLGKLDPDTGPLGQRQKYQVTASIGEGEATKARLTDIFRGAIEGGPPSVVFTGSHGAEWAIADPEIQKARQGALVTQAWTKGKPLEPDHYFAAADFPADAKAQGMMVFLFACFGGGCPDKDSYFFNKDGSKIAIAPQPFIAALPQAMLRSGVLAVIAHNDRAFSYGFEDLMGTPQAQLLRTPLELLMKGKTVGFATDCLSQQWGSLAAQLGLALGGNLPGNPQPSSALLANLFIARDDARNYIVLGDPATRLRLS